MGPPICGQPGESDEEGAPASSAGASLPQAVREQLKDTRSFSPSQIGVSGETTAARGVGAALFNWLAAHFPCRLFADPERRRPLLPQLLLQVHPSPAVELLQQQQQHLKIERPFNDSVEPPEEQPQQPQHQQQQHRQQEVCPRLQQRLKHLATSLCTPSSDLTAAPNGSGAAGSSSSSQDANSTNSSVGEGRRCSCEGFDGLHGVAWICSVAENAQEGEGAPARCAIDDFACPFAFAVDARGVCDIFPLPTQQPQRQQQQEQQQQEQQQQEQQQPQQHELQALEGFSELSALAECSPLRVCLKGGPPRALELLLQKLSEVLAEQRVGGPSMVGPLHCVTDAVLRELLFFLWGPPDACMAVDAAACDFAQWRLSVDLCSSCSKKRFPVYEQHLSEPAETESSSSSSSNSGRSGEEELSLCGVCATCTCCCLRCCCIRVPPRVLEAVARDGLRLLGRASSSSSSSSKRGEVPLERLLRVSRGGCISEPSSGDESWLSELPSSPSTASPLTSPRVLPSDASARSAADGGNHGHMLSASSLDGSELQVKAKEGGGEPPVPPPSNAAAAAAVADAAADLAVAALQSSLSACLPKVGGRVTPLLNNSTLDDAGWMVGGAHNVGSAQGASQVASSRSFLAFACTEPWEVLLLLHASEATTRALGAPLQGCADLLSGFPDQSQSREGAVRPLASRRGVSRQLARQPEDEQQAPQQESTPLRLQLPLWLTLVEATELQKGREFRVRGFLHAGASCVDVVFVACGAAASQLWLGECVPELIKSASLRWRLKRSVGRFISETLPACALPPLFVADLYVHRNADGTETCRLLMLHPWGSLTDPLLFSYEELRELLLIRSCSSEAAACEACCSSARAGGAAKATAAASKLRSCSCWERCELRYLRGSDAQVHDAQRALAMPRDLLEIARSGGSSSHVEDLLLELKSAHLDVIKKQQRRK
ncbi:hypothetical protein Esti_000833 [Eimeria stiedai]